MDGKRKQQLIFSIILIVFSGICYYMASNFLVAKDASRLGPDFWPKMLCVLIFVFSAFDVGVLLTKKKSGNHTPTESNAEIDSSEDAKEQTPTMTYPKLLLGGILSTGIYIFIQPSIGFFISTVLYLAAIMILGRYRKKKVIISASLIGAFSILVIFSKIVYVSLPTGTGIFGEFTFLLYRILGVS